MDWSAIVEGMRRVFFALGLVSLLLVPAGQAAAGVNDFVISNFHADYYLSQDSDGRSQLKTVEQITAQFPDTNQNHGIERALPAKYDGHKTSLQVLSVTNGAGQSRPYTVRDAGELTVLRIGSPDVFVHGAQTYEITYSQRDVTKYFNDTDSDEFYWDTNGTAWQQPFSTLTATVHVDKALASKLSGKHSCYQGAIGLSQACTITKHKDSDGTVTYDVSATRALTIGENVTFAIGFAPHTFAAYSASPLERVLSIIAVLFGLSLLLISPIAIGLLIWFFIHYRRNKYRKGDMGSIAVEYIPPKDTSVLVAAKVFGENKGDPKAAQLVDLAVRHYIKIYQTEEKSMLHAAEYEIELVKPHADLLPEEQAFITTLFGGKSRVAIKDMKRDTSLHTSFVRNDQELSKSLVSPRYALYEKDIEEQHWFRRAALITGILGVLLLSPLMLVAAAVAFGFSFTTQQVSAKGLALERYLYGLREYIKLAEADRLKMLQSPEGAEKVGVSVDGKDPMQLVKLYERVLPYAVLFGEEKGWNEQLGNLYQQANVQPVWYVGPAAFNAAVFSSAISSFSSSASYSSSSGGSGGGGFSGGGGGGGGGGGW